MVLRATGDLQAVPLDRVREDDGGPLRLGTRGLERGQDVCQVVTAEIGDEMT